MANINGMLGNDIINGTALSDFIHGRGGDDTIYGNGGNDFILGDDGNESITGGTGDDEIHGRDGNDTIVLVSGDGRDFIDGGSGDDIILLRPEDASGSTYEVEIYHIHGVEQIEIDSSQDLWLLADGLFHLSDADKLIQTGDQYLGIKGGSQDDLIFGFDIAAGDYIGAEYASDEIYGRQGDDTLVGHAGDDTLSGGDGDDTLHGDEGSDVLDGGDGIDTAAYSTKEKGVYVDLGDPGNNTNDALGDTYISIENILGSYFDDVLKGDTGDNSIDGAGGSDVLDGGDGIDTADYSSARKGVSVDLIDTSNNTNDALGDSYISIENILGSDFDDVLKGDAGDNSIDGAGGSDVLDGGDGIDTAAYSSASEGVYVDLTDTSNNTKDALGDTYVSIENILGSSFDDFLKGDAGDNSIDGAVGSDTLFGEGGADTINGNGGDDLISGDDGNDSITGGTGDDEIYGGDGNDTIVLVTGDGRDFIVGGSGDDIVLLRPEETSSSTYEVEIGFIDSVEELEIESSQDFRLLADGIFDVSGVDKLVQTGDQYLGIEGGSGDDTIFGFDIAAGNYTGAEYASDEIYGREGVDILFGLAGDDTLSGGDGNDGLSGGAGNDVLQGDDGADVLGGGDGIDTAAYSSASEGVYVDLTDTSNNTKDALGDTYVSIENILGSSFDDFLKGDAGDNSIDGAVGSDTLFGEGGADTINGNGGDDLISGDDGNDSITGGTGDDEIYGGDGNDTIVLVTGDGRDFIVGGNGDDIVLLRPEDTSGSTYEVTIGFVYGVEELEIESSQDLRLLADGIFDVSGVDKLVQTGDQYLGIEGGSGDDIIYGFDIAAGNYTGAENASDEIYGREGVDILFGLAGDDTLSGGDGNDGLSGGAGNDVLQGDDGADVLDGGDGTDSLSGGAGNDVLQGAGGADVLDGGDGIDTAAYSSAGAGVSVDLTDTSNNTNDALGDTYISVENILGSNFDDVLKGDAGDNSIDGAGGADVLDGGDGIDTADYSSAGEGVYVDLIATGNNTNDALGDTYVSIENILGSSFDDVLKGDAGENSIDGAGGSDTIVGRVGDDTLLGGDGNDRLSAAAGDDSLDGGSGNDVLIGGAGADTLNGGDGNDTADYSTAASGVDVDFLFFDTTGNSGEAEGDVYTSVENLTGSLHADDLRGDGNGNVIRGRQGNDYINGKQGDDRINGGKGDDTLIGGGGADLFILKNDTGSDRISGFKLTGSSADKIDVSAFNFASYSALEVEFSTQGTDTLISLDDTNGDSVLLLDIALADLGQEHFIL